MTLPEDPPFIDFYNIVQELGPNGTGVPSTDAIVPVEEVPPIIKTVESIIEELGPSN